MIGQFKVLKYAGILVDISRLSDGIYSTLSPKLMPMNTNLEDLINQRMMVRSIMPLGSEEELMFPDSYFDNLRKCHLQIVTLNAS